MGNEFFNAIIVFVVILACVVIIARCHKRCNCYIDNARTKVYITGDKHRHFDAVAQFCKDWQTSTKDVLIILGDAGLNYYGDERDSELKAEVSKLPITLFCVHGNKENRPQNIDTYGLRNFCGAKVYYEPSYPNIVFAIDGEIYTFNNRDYLVIGGAHSVDKQQCLEDGRPFWEDEMPDLSVKSKIEQVLAKRENKVYGILTHTCPINYLPTEMFISTREGATFSKATQSEKGNYSMSTPFKPDIDRSTEEWLGRIEGKTTYEKWFCGHFHIDKQIDKINMMYKDIRPLRSLEKA